MVIKGNSCEEEKWRRSEGGTPQFSNTARTMKNDVIILI